MRSIAVIGAGYWGPNLVRNFRNSPDWDLVAVCDLDEARARQVVGRRSTVEVETSVERLLQRDDLDAVAIATPARTHASLALAAFEAGKHVLVEKPLADNAETAAQMVEAAEERGRVLMFDHTYCYTPAVQLHPRARRSRASSARSSTSTRCGSTSAWSSPTSTCSGTSPRTTCRSSTSSCPAACDPVDGVGARRRPARAPARPASAT